MSYVSLCVILIEATEDSPDLESFSYLAPKYREMADEAEGGADLKFVPGEAKQSRGTRVPHQMSVDTYDIKDPDTTEAEGERDVVQFSCGNPTTEVVKGVLHLYKEIDRTSVSASDPGPSDMLCLLAVPSNMSCHDVLQFVAPFLSRMERIKILLDTVPNQYMVLIKFKTNKDAADFYNLLNGTPYNSFEDDICKIVYVSRVVLIKESEDNNCTLIGHAELPICPVCLERMDESVDGVLTILCNHSFHSACLTKWSDARCPVCRYVQTPELVASNQCFECHSSESVWICLICGNIGCGRYVHGHAYKHFCETSHCYAIQPDNNRVWDYYGDVFVHRLMNNKGDGKLVEVPGARREGCEGGGDEKLESMQMEFSNVLASQLEAQRHFFEDKINSLKEELNSEVVSFKSMLETKEKENEDLKASLSLAQKEKAGLDKKINAMHQKMTKILNDLKDEKEINGMLKSDQTKWRETVEKLETKNRTYIAEKDAELRDLKEQVRDLMFFIEGKKKIESSSLSSEIAEGTLQAQETAKSSSNSHRRRRKH